MNKRQITKAEKIMQEIRSIIDELDKAEDDGDYSNSYYADKFSFAANLIEVTLDEVKAAKAV